MHFYSNEYKRDLNIKTQINIIYSVGSVIVLELRSMPLK